MLPPQPLCVFLSSGDNTPPNVVHCPEQPLSVVLKGLTFVALVVRDFSVDHLAVYADFLQDGGGNLLNRLGGR